LNLSESQIQEIDQELVEYGLNRMLALDRDNGNKAQGLQASRIYKSRNTKAAEIFSLKCHVRRGPVQCMRNAGHEGEQTGPVYKITVGRDDLGMKEHGAAINARMGLNTWAAFVGTQEDAAIAGDVAMLEEEVTPVLKALRKNGLDVVAIHHHMTGDRPFVIFLHYWGRGPAEKLAAGFKAALDELGKGAPAHGGAH